MTASTISGINRLPDREKRELYSRLIPSVMVQRFQIPPDFHDEQGNDLLDMHYPSGSSATEMKLFHRVGFHDPILYGHITDTFNGQVHILLYIINDPESPRFDVDRMPDGRPTRFGTDCRNIEAETAALHYGLAPGQIRRGLRMLTEATQTFENFIAGLGNTLFFAEPLYYHTAILFEKLGFSYEKGRRLMDRIQTGFSAGGDLITRLDSTTAFRQPEAANSIRLRSWAIHDGILGEPYTNVTMYKLVGKYTGISTCKGCDW